MAPDDVVLGTVDIGRAEVNPLANFESKYTTLAGITGGAVSLIAGNMKLVTEVASCVGAVAGAMVAVLSLWMKYSEWMRDRRRRRARRLERFAVPPDVDDNFPGA